MRQIYAILATLAVVLATLVGSAGVATAHGDRGDRDRERSTLVMLRPNANSGISAMIVIRGTSVRGMAAGLDPAKRYVTLYYGSQSTARPNQPLTCADARTAVGAALLPPLRDWTTSPEWRVKRNGAGRLRATADRTLNERPRTFTVSIREVPAGAPADPYVGFNPARYPVVACGAVRR